jgi:hypothetical protein
VLGLVLDLALGPLLLLLPGCLFVAHQMLVNQISEAVSFVRWSTFERAKAGEARDDEPFCRCDAGR